MNSRLRKWNIQEIPSVLLNSVAKLFSRLSGQNGHKIWPLGNKSSPFLKKGRGGDCSKAILRIPVSGKGESRKTPGLQMFGFQSSFLSKNRGVG
jgi:hypothetical protein